MNRTLIVMFLAQMFALTGVPVVILLGGLVGAKMAPTPALATLPVSLSIIGIAVSTIPAALFMARFGRRAGFLTGAGYACLAGIIAASAIAMENFWLFCAATFLIGSNNAFVQQIRFAVAESTTEDKVPSYLATLMLAGVVAAYIGPETARQLHDWSNWGQYSGSFLGVSLLMAISFVLLSFYKNGQREIQPVRSEDHRSISSVLRQPVFLLAVAAAASGYTVMSLVMTATPISMHIHDHFSLEDTTWVIQSHIMAMYLPSLFSGYLIARLGPRQIIGWGMLILTACLIIAWQEMALMHYWW
ncbi:MAG: MFS transporter, partial [Gammaproteobacteria bacterium]|nr:MFS transporter [Gammaproteobacteria bacterium]